MKRLHLTALDPNRIAAWGLGLLSVALLTGITVLLFQQNRRWTVTIAAGHRAGESFVLAQALKAVAEQRYPALKINVRETGGTAENLALLESGGAQFATAQADVPAGPSARVVAILYADAFQLLAKSQSPVRTFTDLAGRSVALPMQGGQFRSFLRIAEHFGLDRSSFHFIDDDGRGFLSGPADALFQVRALGNPMVAHLVRRGGLRPVPIDQAAAMRILVPAFDPGIVPKGAYSGAPAVPAEDTATVVVQRMLLAHRSAPEPVVEWLTASLMEQRIDIARAIPESFAEVRPLLASVRQPEASTVGIAIHPGALAYYEKDKPSFVQSHADVLALILSVVVLVGSWIWELKRLLQRAQKNRADLYRTEMIGLMRKAQAAHSLIDLAEVRKELMSVLTRSVSDLDEDRISEASFQSLRGMWEIAIDAVRERRLLIEDGHSSVTST